VTLAVCVRFLEDRLELVARGRVGDAKAFGDGVASKAMGEFGEAFELCRPERSIRNASLDRQALDVLPVPDLDSCKPSQTVRCKKVLIISAARHLFRSGEIEVTSNAAPKECWQGR
jgi:hypothetical protein